MRQKNKDRYFKRYDFQKPLTVYSYGVEDVVNGVDISEQGICFITKERYYKLNDSIIVQFLDSKFPSEPMIITLDYRIKRITNCPDGKKAIGCELYPPNNKKVTRLIQLMEAESWHQKIKTVTG